MTELALHMPGRHLRAFLVVAAAAWLAGAVPGAAAYRRCLGGSAAGGLPRGDKIGRGLAAQLQVRR